MVCTLVAVVEQADVPVRMHAGQEFHQRARPLRELEAEQALVAGQLAAATDHMPDMLLGELIVRQVQGLEASLAEGAGQPGGFIGLGDRNAHEDVGDAGIGDAVVELGHAARAEQFTEALEAAARLRNGHREQGLAALADLRPFGDEAQPVEVHVGAAGDRDQGLALSPGRRGVLLDRGDAHRPGGFEDGAGVLEHVLDRGADGVGVDEDVVVDQLTGYAEGLLADQLDRSAVRKQTDVLQLHALAGLDRADHGVGVCRLHADDPDFGAQRLDVGRDAGDQAAAADRNEDRVNGARMLAQHFHRDGALAGDDVGVVEGVDEGQPLRALEFLGMGEGVAETLSMQHDLAAMAAYRVDLDLGRGHRHHDDRPTAELACRQGDPLCMVACRGADDAGSTLLGAQLRHLVVGAAQLEAEDVLLVLALQPHLVAEPPGQFRRARECGLACHVVHPRVQDALQVAAAGRQHRGRLGRRMVCSCWSAARGAHRVSLGAQCGAG
mmetsp:Transcript_9617/g.22294  ORF Transcript_9617/g.22294 Transcript_9617/m.22294 type:complete len:496 (+) Transcript_9617:394-1881(+)